MNAADVKTGVTGSLGTGQVSVVVIGRNEGERLVRCFASVAALAKGAHLLETIYVDSGSRDESVALATRSGAKTIRLHTSRPTAASGRNAGWRAAAGEFVLFLDGDTELAPAFLTLALPCMTDPQIAIVWGHRRELHPQASLYNRALDLDWIYPPGLTEFCGGDALFRRSLLIKTGGFDETLIAGEEPELCRRVIAAGSSILHIDEAMTSHDLAITHFSQYWKRAMRAGHAYAEVSARFANTAQPFWRAEARRNQVRAVLLFSGFLLILSAALLLHSVLPVVLGIALFALLVGRTAWKARWKSGDAGTLSLYAIHSHLQQIPIFCGQVGFHLSRYRGVQRGLVEYKEQ